MAAPDLTADEWIFILETEDDDFLLFNLLPEERESTYNPAWPRFNLENLTDAQCKAYFRFIKEDIYRLAAAFGFPESFKLPNRCIVAGIDGLCMVLRRFCYPNRLVDLEEFFGRPKSTLSMAIKVVVNFIYDRHSHRLQEFNQHWIKDRLQTYADAVAAKGSPLTNIIGFIDGTVRPLCRPIRYQRVLYNGHKRIHAIKFQSVVGPDGMILNMFGPIEGRRHDCALLRLSELQEKFEAMGNDFVDANGVRYSLYGDPAYPVRDYLISPFRGNNLTPLQGEFNSRMSSVRECVEWEFGHILSEFAFLDFRKNLKILLQPVGMYYLVGALLKNCHTCLYESQTGRFFDLLAPELEEYLG